MSNRKFELIYEFVHCKGTQTHVAGIVVSEAEAREWVRTQQERIKAGEKGDFKDDTFECPVTLCPLKKCLPTFGYREKR